MKLAVVIPVFNEAGLLERSFERVERTPPPLGVERFIVLVDDGSTDGTRDIVGRLGETARADVVLHERNRGKGAALRTGFARALELEADVLLVQDADMEYDPDDHADVLAPILDGRADAVIGSRFIGTTHRVLYYWHAVANRFITLCSNMLTNLNLSDIECCSKAMTRACAERVTIEEDRFGVEPELVAKLARMRLPADGGRGRQTRVYEVAVSYAGRTYDEGKKITWRDGVRALWCIAKYNVR